MTSLEALRETLPEATLKRDPADFVVEEIPAYAPSGQGDHVYVTFRKTGLGTDEATRSLARALGANAREIGVAGLKDKHARTTQTASFLLTKRGDEEAVLARAALPGIEILSVSRHGNKLKPGHLRGNRFEIRLREIAEADRNLVVEALERSGRDGVPNAFGAQRFGRNNAERAIAWVLGRPDARPPRDRKDQRFLFSSLQSQLFNTLLARRIEDGTWNRVLLGDLAKKTDTGGLFLVTEADAEDAALRGEAGALSPTGPMYGASMRWPEGKVLALEQEILAASGITEEALASFRQLGEGTRRPLRIEVEHLAVRTTEDGVAVEFVLPKGAYATTVLAQTCRIRQAPPSSRQEGAETSPPTDVLHAEVLQADDPQNADDEEVK